MLHLRAYCLRFRATRRSRRQAKSRGLHVDVETLAPESRRGRVVMVDVIRGKTVMVFHIDVTRRNACRCNIRQRRIE